MPGSGAPSTDGRADRIPSLFRGCGAGAGVRQPAYARPHNSRGRAHGHNGHYGHVDDRCRAPLPGDHVVRGPGPAVPARPAARRQRRRGGRARAHAVGAGHQRGPACRDGVRGGGAGGARRPPRAGRGHRRAAGFPTPQEQVTDAPHGRGLHIVRTLADAWGIEVRRDRPGKTVWFSLPLAADDGPAKDPAAHPVGQAAPTGLTVQTAPAAPAASAAETVAAPAAPVPGTSRPGPSKGSAWCSTGYATRWWPPTTRA